MLYSYTGAEYIPPDVAELSAGDTVRVELDPDLFKIAQEEHGGWNDLMAEVYTTSMCTCISYDLVHLLCIYMHMYICTQ